MVLLDGVRLLLAMGAGGWMRLVLDRLVVGVEPQPLAEAEPLLLALSPPELAPICRLPGASAKLVGVGVDEEPQVLAVEVFIPPHRLESSPPVAEAPDPHDMLALKLAIVLSVVFCSLFLGGGVVKGVPDLLELPESVAFFASDDDDDDDHNTLPGTK
jgi:hypothetical protein